MASFWPFHTMVNVLKFQTDWGSTQRQRALVKCIRPCDPPQPKPQPRKHISQFPDPPHVRLPISCACLASPASHFISTWSNLQLLPTPLKLGLLSTSLPGSPSLRPMFDLFPLTCPTPIQCPTFSNGSPFVEGEGRCMHACVYTCRVPESKLPSTVYLSFSPQTRSLTGLNLPSELS